VTSAAVNQWNLLAFHLSVRADNSFRNLIRMFALSFVTLLLNTLRTGSFKLFKRPFPGFLTIVTL